MILRQDQQQQQKTASWEKERKNLQLVFNKKREKKNTKTEIRWLKQPLSIDRSSTYLLETKNHMQM